MDLLSGIAVLDPQGAIAFAERNLLFVATGLMLLVVIPVFVLTFYFAWKYRANNTAATYSPNWAHSRTEEFIWWGVPAVIILILAVLAWESSHGLDPYRPIVAVAEPMTIQVVALDWKWLFIYPEQNIATVNYVRFPAETPINFQLTADAPMNSFWIPRLGGQMYAMAGMVTQLYLMADGAGRYNGSSANISGAGFSGMKFIAESTSQEDFESWVQTVKESPKVLTLGTYNQLAEPTMNHKEEFYSATEKDLYSTIVMKFMPPIHQH